MPAKSKVKIAHLAGPTATIQNSPPLVTSNKARRKYGLPPRKNPDGSEPRFDVLRAQRLAAPAKVYVECFSAHPLEADAAELYGPPDGYLDAKGVFQKQRTAPQDRPVFEIEIQPEDGLVSISLHGAAGRRPAMGGRMHDTWRAFRASATGFLSGRIAQF